MDTGDHVVVINADKIELTGNKGEDKYAYRHSGLSGRHHRRQVQGPHDRSARGRRREGRPRHAPEEHPRAPDDQEAPRRPRRRASARRAVARVDPGRRAPRVGRPAGQEGRAPVPRRRLLRREARRQAESGRQAEDRGNVRGRACGERRDPEKPKAATKTAKPKPKDGGAKPKAATAKPKAAAKPKTAAKPAAKKTDDRDRGVTRTWP